MHALHRALAASLAAELLVHRPHAGTCAEPYPAETYPAQGVLRVLQSCHTRTRMTVSTDRLLQDLSNIASQTIPAPYTLQLSKGAGHRVINLPEPSQGHSPARPTGVTRQGCAFQLPTTSSKRHCILGVSSQQQSEQPMLGASPTPCYSCGSVRSPKVHF